MYIYSRLYNSLLSECVYMGFVCSEIDSKPKKTVINMNKGKRNGYKL